MGFWGTLIITFFMACSASAQEAASNQDLDALSAELVESYNAGDSRGALKTAQALVSRAREQFDAEDPALMTFVTTLALLQRSQGRFQEAEALFLEALEVNRRFLGEEHPDTLSSIDSLATLYLSQGKYGEAERLYLETLRISRRDLGEEHLQTLTSVHSLAGLYLSQARYGEAEPLFLNALAVSRRVLGVEDPRTLTILSNLGSLYSEQGHYDKARSLLQEALEVRRKVLDPEHPDILTSINNLALLYIYMELGGFGEAERLLRDALEDRRRVLGPEHPQSLGALNNLAGLYLSQKRYKEAEPLLLEALVIRHQVLGVEHPDTINSVNNLAGLYLSQARYNEAEPLFVMVLESRRSVRGDTHPETTNTALNLVSLLISTERYSEAMTELEQLGPQLLRRAEVELGTTRRASTRRLLLQNQTTYQDVVLGLAQQYDDPNAVWLAADVMLRWKGLSGEQEAFLAQLVLQADDPAVAEVGSQLIATRSALATAYQSDPDSVPRLISLLEDQEAALSKLSANYRQSREVFDQSPRDIAASLSEDAILIEYRQFRPFDHETREWQSLRLAAVRLSPSATPVFEDLGPMPDDALIAAVRNGDIAAAKALSVQLLAPFSDDIALARDVYLVPDGALHLVPFAQLPFAQYEHLILDKTTNLRLLQSGRDLGRQRGAVDPTGGLVAFGGIDFGDAGNKALTLANLRSPGIDTTDPGDTLRQTLGLFAPLPATLSEAQTVERLYRASFPGEPVAIHTKTDARELRLKTMATAPRVLHLATHGFYLPTDADVERPMLLSGITMAGANRGRDGKLDPDGEDGILYAIEATGLNLNGTELVALSACDTAQGQVDYSEGVFGLSRALRIAGADNVLITLWPLSDQRAQFFMEEFYALWFREGGDPGDSLAAIQRQWANDPNPYYATPQAWAPYILIQAGK